MPTTLIDPDIELAVSRRVRNATLFERAVHGEGNWTMQDEDGLSIPLRYVVINGVPKFVGEFCGSEDDSRFVGRFSLCHEGDAVMWFTLDMMMHDGDEVVVDFT